MTRLDELGRLRAVFLVAFLNLTFQGAYCELLLSPAGPTQVNALVGSNVTLAVSFSGAPGPAVTWSMGDLPVITWTINSLVPPDIAENRREVLRIEPDGSLTFVNVPLSYTSNYTIEMTKSGVGTSSTTFTLRVFENIQNVSLSTQPEFAQEGSERFTLQYRMLQGVVEQEMWFFNGLQINTDSRYSLEQRSLVIHGLNRNDTGQYAVLLTNPFSSGRTRMNVTVLYGPDDPIIEVHPAQSFYVAGDSLSLSCRAEGFPEPTAKWVFGGQTLSDSRKGVLNLTHVQTSQGGVYTCTLLNEQTKAHRRKSMKLNVYERPSANPVCSVQSVNNVDLQYQCLWSGGTPEAQLSFPALSNSSGAGDFNLLVAASENLNGKFVTCTADHPTGQNKCNITASSPVEFLPAVGATVESEVKIVVSIHCVSVASPRAVVSWSRGSEAVTNDTTYRISSDTTQLSIHHYNISNFLHQNYTCVCRNSLGSQRRDIELRGPSISDFSVSTINETAVTLTWEVPSTSVVTGFDIQMKGPALIKSHYGTQARDSRNTFQTILQKNGSDRTADIFGLNPDLTYRFWVIPKALIKGEPSKVLRIGPAEGLSGPAIAGIAAGIPCSLLFLLLLGGSIYLCVYCNKNKSRPTRYPAARAVEKAISTQTITAPHNLLAGGLKSPPAYNSLQQTPSERSGALPTFVPPPPVRVATTV